MTPTAAAEVDRAGRLAPHAPARRPASVPGPTPSRRRGTGLALGSAELRWAGLSLVAFLLAVAGRGLGAPRLVPDALFGVCYATGGWEPAVTGLRALRRRTLDVDILMIVAALVAAAIGQVVDGGLLIVIFSTSGAVEAVATRRTRDAVHSLLTLAPEQATRVSGGREHVVDTATLAVGDVIVVRPGERIGADGHVVGGASEVDQASITGEPLPVTKVVGDPVFAGSLNGDGVLRARVDRAAADSVIARIVALVDEASATKAHTQLFVDRIEQRYSVGVVAATLALFAIPMALGGTLQPVLLRAMTFMIVASPCAVVLATMPPLLSAIANAGRHGVLVKSAVVMEQLGRTQLVAFDKTGTLTEGTPWVAEVVVLPGAPVPADRLPADGLPADRSPADRLPADRLPADRMLALAAAAENPSEHPLARAIVAAARERGIAVGAAQDFRSTPGQGVTAAVDGRQVTVGRALPTGPESGIAGVTAALARQGMTAVVISVDDTPVGAFGLTDRLRSAAPATVAELAALTGRTPMLLTGDSAGAAERLAAAAGIGEVRADLLPSDKVAEVRARQSAGIHVTMVGDGVNDAPALAAASTGVAMGRHGSDLALETADAVLVRDDLTMLPALIQISRRAHRVVVQNLWIAGTAITSLVFIDLTGHLALPWGVAGHEGSTVLVGLNGLRLLSRRAWCGKRSG